LDRILNYIQKKGFEGELFFTESENWSYVKGKRSESKEYYRERGYAVRVLKKEELGFAFFEDKNKFRNAVDLAIKTRTRSPNFSFPNPQKYRKVDNCYSKIRSFNIDDAMEQILDETKGRDTKSVVEMEIAKEEVCNTNGVEAKEVSTAFYGYAHVNFENSTAHYSEESIKPFDFSKIGRNAYEYSKDMNKANKINEKTNIVFSTPALLEFLSSFLYPAIDGDGVRRNSSFFNGKLNKKVAGRNLSILENPFEGFSSCSFDDEGNKTERKSVIQEGILKNFFYDQKNALAEKKEKKPASAGNAVRASYKTPPHIGMTNIEIGSGKQSIDEKNLFHIISFFGEHTANEITGDFSINVDIGYFRGKPVKNVTISDNFFSMLNRIEGIGKERERWGSILSPKIEFADCFVKG